ncbi:dysbindin-A-like isoform X2 [Syngnathoides biaculeatus]|uniref:dysbindin-A-like isoform X2 n=1 Tax=Syngnathoides biaculeatus TaxID=300417 RepID=UPI002ADDC456|nr:dysbindin-A-like isoform X2 [Syngnathoides biaculeatus]
MWIGRICVVNRTVSWDITLSGEEPLGRIMFENFRERLHMVQQDLTTGLKTLGDKSKESKSSRRKSRYEESLHFNAGLDILSRYEESWFVLHKKTKDCAQVAGAVDGDVVMLSAHWEKRRAALIQLQEQLQSLPTFISELDAITASMTHLEGDFEQMESRLAYLEKLCCQCEQQMLKQQHINELEVYKKKKRRELETLEVELNAEHNQKVAKLEQMRQQKLRERQKVYEEAFNQDLEIYRSTGCLQHRVTNLSDQEALDDFLNSGDDFSSGASLTSGPDLKSSSLGSLSNSQSLVPDIGNHSSDKDSECVHDDDGISEDSDEPVVQFDEEDVQADMTLVGLQDLDHVRGSDDSDSPGDMLCG